MKEKNSKKHSFQIVDFYGFKTFFLQNLFFFWKSEHQARKYPKYILILFWKRKKFINIQLHNLSLNIGLNIFLYCKVSLRKIKRILAGTYCRRYMLILKIINNMEQGQVIILIILNDFNDPPWGWAKI